MNAGGAAEVGVAARRRCRRPMGAVEEATGRPVEVS